VNAGYLFAAVLFTGIAFTGLVVFMRNRTQSLNMRSELDQRGENVIKFQELLSWASSNGAKGVDNLALAFFDRGGYEVTGLTRASKASTGARDAHPMINLPALTILSEANDKFQKTPFAINKPEELTIVVYLAIERRKTQANGWQASFWSPIIRLLPSPLDYSTFHPFYAKPELLVSFSTLPVTLSIRQQQMFIQTTWDANHVAWEELAQKEGVEGFGFEDYKWAFTAWKAHSNMAYDKKLNRNISCMVPFVASMTASAAAKANADWSFDGDGPLSSVTLQLRPEARPGAELFEAKSQIGRANDEVFEHYGELLQNNDVPLKQLGDVECDLLAVRLGWSTTTADKGDTEQHQLLRSFQALATEYCRKSWAPRTEAALQAPKG